MLHDGQEQYGVRRVSSTISRRQIVGSQAPGYLHSLRGLTLSSEDSRSNISIPTYLPGTPAGAQPECIGQSEGYTNDKLIMIMRGIE